MSATTPSSTALRPHSAAMFGSSFVSHVNTLTLFPPTPFFLLSALAAASAPCGKSGLAARPAVFSKITITFTVPPVGFAAAGIAAGATSANPEMSAIAAMCERCRDMNPPNGHGWPGAPDGRSPGSKLVKVQLTVKRAPEPLLCLRFRRAEAVSTS